MYSQNMLNVGFFYDFFSNNLFILFIRSITPRILTATNDDRKKQKSHRGPNACLPQEAGPKGGD